jgi:hypothetical protein
MAPAPDVPDVYAGLCDRCTNVHIIENRRGSRFYRCRLADVDPAFVRYPPLPVLSCPGFVPEEPSSVQEDRK